MVASRYAFRPCILTATEFKLAAGDANMDFHGDSAGRFDLILQLGYLHDEDFCKVDEPDGPKELPSRILTSIAVRQVRCLQNIECNLSQALSDLNEGEDED